MAQVRKPTQRAGVKDGPGKHFDGASTVAGAPSVRRNTKQPADEARAANEAGQVKPVNAPPQTSLEQKLQKVKQLQSRGPVTASRPRSNTRPWVVVSNSESENWTAIAAR